MSETAPNTLDGAHADAPIEAQGTCEKPVSPNCESTALYTVVLPDDAMTVPCCEPCKDEHVKRTLTAPVRCPSQRRSRVYWRQTAAIDAMRHPATVDIGK